MGKKKKKKKTIYQPQYVNINSYSKSKKSLDKEFRNAIDEIETCRIRMYEADKRTNRKERKKINKKEAEFYTDMESIKCRRKIAKKWKRTGFLDVLIVLLQQVAPIVRILAKMICSLIITFLSIDGIKQSIEPDTLKKISNVYDIAMVL